MGIGTRAIRGAFKPFEYLDLNSLYDAYWPIADLLLYTVFFTGVSLVALQKRFPGRAGKAIVVSISITLALSLTLAERNLGFRLGDLGVGLFGMGLILIVTIFLLGNILRQLGAGAFLAYSGSFAVVGLISMGAVPTLWDYLIEIFPLIPALYLLSVLIVIGHFGYKLSRMVPRSNSESKLQQASKKSISSFRNMDKIPSQREDSGRTTLLEEYRLGQEELKTLHEWRRELLQANTVLKRLEQAVQHNNIRRLGEAWRLLIHCSIHAETALQQWAKEMQSWEHLDGRLMKEAEGVFPSKQESMKLNLKWKRLLKEKGIFNKMKEREKSIGVLVGNFKRAMQQFKNAVMAKDWKRAAHYVHQGQDTLDLLLRTSEELIKLDRSMLKLAKDLSEAS